jgi:DNA repair protein RadD
MRSDRPHQTRALEMLSEGWRSGSRAQLLCMPTGSGKTHCALRCASMAIDRGHQVLWIVHREELWKQPRDRILEDGWRPERLQIIAGGRRHGAEDAPLTIASIQTLRNWARLGTQCDRLPRAQFVIFDEARHYVAADWRVVAKSYERAHRLGLDATPIREDGAPMRDLFDRLVVPTSVQELVDAKLLVPHTVWAPAEFQDELAKDPVEAYFELCAGSIAVVFCASVGHAKLLAQQFNDAGISAASVDGKTDEDVREQAFRAFSRGDIRVLTNVRIATEGTDVPAIETVIHAAPCRSLSDWIQKGGRGLRTSPGKTSLKVIDLHGSIHLGHGLLDDPHEFSLDGAGITLSEGLPPLAQCPQCFAWGRSARSCPSCGRALPEVAPKPPKIRAADLVEVRAGDSVDRRRERLNRWAVEEIRRGSSEGLTSHKLTKRAYRCAHRYRGTYGEDAPKEWLDEAVKAAWQVLWDDQERDRAKREPLFAGVG